MSVREREGARELNVDPEFVRLIVVKAQAAFFEMPDPEETEPLAERDLDPATTVTMEDPALLTEERRPDATPDETAAMIDTLNIDEQAEVIALTLVGRGDYEPAELEVAVREAKQNANGPASRRLFEIDLFPSLLGDGLDRYEAWVAEQAG